MAKYRVFEERTLEGNGYEKNFGVSKLGSCQLSAENETLIQSKKNTF